MKRLLKHTLKKIIAPKYVYLRKFPIAIGDVVIDLGANVGEVTEYFERKKALVFAYEPNPYAYKVLSKLYGDSDRVTLHKAAVSNYTGSSQLWLHENHDESEVEFSQASSLQADKSNVSNDSVNVDTVDISDVLSPHDHIRLLKIDIEGGEYDIIDEILKNIEKIDYVLLETHGHKHEAFAVKEKELKKKIDNSGYKEKFYTDWF